MNTDFAAAMGRALELTRAGDPAAATRYIQAALAGQPEATAPIDPERPPPKTSPRPDDVEDAEIIEDSAPPFHTGPPWQKAFRGKPGQRRHLRDVVDALRKVRASMPEPGPLAGRGTPPPIPEGARWETRSFTSAHGARDYRLYVPATLSGAPKGLVLMLHGCTQDPDDFASGTGMNAQAERYGVILVYPHQSRNHNVQGCWNWFRPGDQTAHSGEPAVLADLARAVAAEFAVDPACIFAAGLSAGGAMAATLGATAPELFSAIGVHSGLPHGSARDVISAFAAMRGETPMQTRPVSTPVRTIVFHGTADTVVHASNGAAIVAAQSRPGRPTEVADGRSAGGRAFSRARVTAPDGTPLTEHWRIDGLGHAWSGGQPAGSYTDPAGPDASREFIRFFLKLQTEDPS